MREGFRVAPSRLAVAGARVRWSGRELAVAGREAARSVDEVAAEVPGSLTSAAAAGLADGVLSTVRSLGLAVEALAVTLDTAASRYAGADEMIAVVGARQ